MCELLQATNHMKQKFECPRCGKQHINNRALSEHIHRRNACDPLKSNVPVEELQATYPKPALHTCADCNRQFSRRALHDHIMNKRCSVVKEREAAFIAPDNNGFEPASGSSAATTEHVAATPDKRSYNDPDLSFITRDDMDAICNNPFFSGPNGMIPLFRCVFDRSDQRQNHDLIVCKNVRSSKHLHYWVSDGASRGYQCKEGDGPLKEALEKPMSMLWQHMESKGMLQKPAWLECGVRRVGDEQAFTSYRKALKFVAAFVECKARIKRGCSITGAGVSSMVQIVYMMYADAFA